MKRIALIIILGLSAIGLHAQKTMEVGVFGGGSYYIGDLNPGIHFLMTRPSYGLVARLNLSPRWAIKLSGLRGKVAGDDAVSGYTSGRELKFDSQITDVSAVIELNFLNYITGSTRSILAPYIFGGVGFFMFKPEADGVSLQELGTEGQNTGFDGRSSYQTIQITFPFGFGVKYSLSKKLGFAFEWGIRKTFTDYIDDVSTTYYLNGESINPSDVEQIMSDPTRSHQPYEMRGNPSTKDWYAFFGVSITYKFRLGGSRRCSDFGNRKDY